MKITDILTLIGISVALSSCSDDTPVKPNVVAADDEVNFTVNTSSVDSRTMYGNENADGTSQGLYWGNYNSWIADSIKIFSPHTRFSNANYLITPQSPDSNTAADCTRLGEYGLQWGSNTAGLANYDFYAFYPASRCDDEVEYGTDGSAIVNAWIRPGQSPVSFTTSTSDGITTYLGNPDMRACLMTAHTSAAYGADAVGFHFKPLATVLDVTIKGGNNVTKEGLYMVTLKSKSGKDIVGNFKVDMSTNTMVENSITNGRSEISMMPTMSDFDSEHKPTNVRYVQIGQDDVMKVRFFLIPRSDLEISDLQVVVSTLTRQYTKTLTKEDLATDYQTLKPSQIRKVVLPRFTVTGGRTLEINYWLSELEDNIYATELSIPGAYNAPSSTMSGANKFQVVTAQDQFKSGVRAFKLNVFDDIVYTKSGNQWSLSSKTICYGNATRKTVDSSTGATRSEGGKIGTMDELFTKLNTWLQEEKKGWEGKGNGKPFNDFVVLCVAPYRYYNGANPTATNVIKNEESYEIANSLQAAIEDFNKKNLGAICTEITPETTIKDIAGKIIIHYNASSSPVSKDDKDKDTPSTIHGTDMLFSFWNAPQDEAYYSRPQLVEMVWGQPPVNDGVVTSVASNQLGWLFYEFNGVDDNTGGNFVTVDQMTDAIQNYGIQSYSNYVKGEHNIWRDLEIGGQYKANSTAEDEYPTVMANTFNTILYNYIASGQRIAAPWGIVMMNYAYIPPTSAAATTDAGKLAVNAKSPELIRAIIANNRLFPLQRKADEASNNSIDNGGTIIAPNSWDMPKRR